MGKISIFGISGSGKTCYLYAMSDLFKNQGIHLNSNVSFSLLACNPEQKNMLEGRYDDMVKLGEWPKGTDLQGIIKDNNSSGKSKLESKAVDDPVTIDYEFQVRIAHDRHFDSDTFITISDYAGGWWRQRDYRERLVSCFDGSSAIICFVDGETLLKAMHSEDINPDSDYRDRSKLDNNRAQQDIGYIENMLGEYRRQGKGVPPVLIAITKADVFTSPKELERGKDLLRQQLPSIFARGSGVEAALTAISLGRNLGKDDNKIIGKLEPSVEFNLHIPIVFGYYAYLSEKYNVKNPPNEKEAIISSASAIRDSMKGRVELFRSGETLFPVVIR